MGELNSGEPEPAARLRFNKVEHIDLDHGTSQETGHDGSRAAQLRAMGRKAAHIVGIANLLSPPPPERPQ